ncbi:MAG TPA: lysophospholipid acyltransferase family protein, partial [Alphaproteobacteria bacterium]
MASIRATWRFLLFILLTLILVPVQLVFTMFCGTRTQQSPLVRLWHKAVLRILNIRVTWQGDMQQAWQQQALFVSNHSSYLDIVIMGASMPPFFIAKADTADWPIFGPLIKVGGTLFISRKRSALPQQMRTIRDALAQGKSLFLFPEGTTSDGTITLPFKSTLLK